ncbi:hypothetical protein SDC9_165152 [bioreactor metagenome]|uniref:Uncharacterized protein n=1 Tax=bioreactor metagenome TaxID=1076179 RepID=A0A645FTK1_9ZZZZ
MLDFFREYRNHAGNLKEGVADGFVKQRMTADFVAGVAHGGDVGAVLARRIRGKKESCGNGMTVQNLQNPIRTDVEPLIGRGPAADIGFHVKSEYCTDFAHNLQFSCDRKNSKRENQFSRANGNAKPFRRRRL